MQHSNLILNFAVANRFGPWEDFEEIKTRLRKLGHDTHELANRAEAFMTAGINYRHAIRTGEGIESALMGFREAGFDLGLSEDEVERFTNSRQVIE